MCCVSRVFWWKIFWCFLRFLLVMKVLILVRILLWVNLINGFLSFWVLVIELWWGFLLFLMVFFLMVVEFMFEVCFLGLVGVLILCFGLGMLVVVRCFWCLRIDWFVKFLSVVDKLGFYIKVKSFFLSGLLI